MKKKIINKAVAVINNNSSKYNDEQMEIIIYGLESIYLTISKLIIISLIAYFLGIFKEYLIVLLLFNGVRLTGFGLHASKSSICLIVSTSLFIIMPIICLEVTINNFIKIGIGLVCIIMFYLYAPSDTIKRPIVNPIRRIAYKIITIIIGIIYIIISVTITNNFISNALIGGMLIEVFMIHPIVYKIFKLPYNNYISYLKNATE